MVDKLYTKAEIEADEKGAMRAVASTAIEDRHGEVVAVDGWDLKNFKKNPVLQWAHDYTEPAIGTAKNIHIEGEGKRAKLIFEPEFHDLTPLSKALKQMVEEKIINSFSVGFRPLEVDGNTYTSQELLEISLVNVPANPDARMLAYKSLKGAGFDDEVAKQIGALDEIDQVRAELAATQEVVADLVKGLKHLNPNVRSSEVVTSRLALAKVAARAADKLLEQESDKGTRTAQLAKVVKRASEKLIVDHKQELKSNGKD